MKVAILAGGYGTRLSEETANKPKPMVEIGDYPILWHIMKSYSFHDYKDFVIALGYKGEVIKDFFVNYLYRKHSLTVELKKGMVNIQNNDTEDWTIQLLDTGLNTQTGGRVKSVSEAIGHETFMLTYGDGVSNIDLADLLKFHKNHGKLATITAVRPPARFGEMRFQGDQVTHFEEKPQIGEGWINGGFFVLEPEVVEYIQDDQTVFELGPLENLARNGQLMAYRHDGFWRCMDTLRDVRLLNNLWQENKAPWKVW